MPPCRLATTSSSTPFLMPPLLACSTSADISPIYLLSLPRESSSKGDRFHSTSHKRPERLCFFFLLSFPRLCLSAGSVTRRLPPPPPLPPRGPSRSFGRTATDRPACARIDRMSNRTDAGANGPIARRAVALSGGGSQLHVRE